MPRSDPWAAFADPEPHNPSQPSVNDPWSQFADTQQDSAPVQSAGPSFAQREFSPGNLGRQTGLVGRSVVEGVAALPLMAMDAGVGTRNFIQMMMNPAPKQTLSDLVTGNKPQSSFQPYELPSQMFSRALDAYLPTPKTAGEKVAGFAERTLTGSRIPGPQAAEKAPANYQPALSIKEQTFQNSRDAGYVAPPSSVKPTVGNRIVESVGGKIATEQDAAVKNQDVTNNLVRRALGLSEGEPLTADALKSVRDKASQAYEAVRKVGTVTTDEQYTRDLAAITGKFKGAAKDFPELAKTDIEDIVNAVKKDSFEADSAVDAISILRDKSSTAYSQGDKGLGKAYRAVSDAVEGAIERTLHRKGTEGQESLDAFRSARQLIAKSYSVEKALNPETGNVSAQKLGQQLSRGKYLSGELATAGSFGRAFPKAAKESLDSGSVRNTDVAIGGVTAALSHEPWYLAYPFVRMGFRNYMLSNSVQNSLLQPRTGIAPSTVMGTIPAANSLREKLTR
jgi:hypothetical protein